MNGESKQFLQSQILNISLLQVGLLIRRIGDSLTLTADKNLIDVLEKIRKEIEEKFTERDSKMTDIIKPLSDEIKKSLQCQEIRMCRNE